MCILDLGQLTKTQFHLVAATFPVQLLWGTTTWLKNSLLHHEHKYYCKILNTMKENIYKSFKMAKDKWQPFH